MKTRYSLMIVDDEENVRNLLKACIDWASLGICITSEAGNAQEALDCLERLPVPSIICADICMPVINGIDFIKEIRKRAIASQIVVISGYSEFSYAQQCIRYGVADYIVKPVNGEYLTDTMKKVCMRLDSSGTGGAAAGSLFHVPENPVKTQNRTAAQIADYTRLHFCDRDISLQLLADKFYLNPAYICRVFKQETGENWSEYLTRLRMEKAIELLKTTDKHSYEIAYETGYTDAKYFSLCFKQYTGKPVTLWKEKT